MNGEVNVMKIEVWSDIACPFCYIGHRRLEWALGQVGFADEVSVEYRSFQLDVSAPVHNEMRATEMLARKYGMTEQQAIAMNHRMMEQASSDGLNMKLLDIQLTNTLDAHRVIHYAKAQGKEEAAVEQLFKAYFVESRHVGERQSLLAIAEEAGLDRDSVNAMLDSDRFIAEVELNQEEANTLGIQGVPFYVIDRKYAISGAQAKEVFKQALEQAHADKKVATASGDSCTDDTCRI
jgi:predicted DsbA family dithiol-disulfide isomerase